MTDSKDLDAERLAALIDGRLGPSEAEAIRAQLAAADDETLAVYADAVAMSAESLAGTPGSTAAATRPMSIVRSNRRLITLVSLAAAAGIVAFVLNASKSTGASLAEAYATAVPSSAPVPSSMFWSATRGASDGLSDRTRAARIGALLVDLELEALRGDTTRIHLAALASLTSNIAGGASLSSEIEQIVNAPGAPSPAAIHALGKRVAGLVDPVLANAGSYLEAARLAVNGGDSGFFDRVSNAALLDLAKEPGVDDASKAAATDLAKLTKAQPRDVSVLRVAIETLLHSLVQ